MCHIRLTAVLCKCLEKEEKKKKGGGGGHNLARLRRCRSHGNQRETWARFQIGNETVAPLGHSCASNNICSFLRISRAEMLVLECRVSWINDFPLVLVHREEEEEGGREEEADWQKCVMLCEESLRIWRCLNKYADAWLSAHCKLLRSETAVPHLNPGEFSLKQQVGFNIVSNVGKIRHTATWFQICLLKGSFCYFGCDKV